MSQKVLFIDSCHPYLHQKLSELNYQCDLFWDKSAEELISIIPHYEILIIRSKFKITKEIIDNATNLKCIARAGAGLENIEVAYAEEKGIICLHAPEGNRQAVGEHTLGMLLCLLNNLVRADKEVRKGIWKREANRGFELQSKKVGIIGYGNMGSSFAKCLSGIGCEILAHDKYKSGFSNDYVQEVSMETIFEEVEIISLHTPLTTETKYFIDEAFIGKFKKNIIILNTARGKCLNTEALVEGIKSGKILGACLDVLEYESISFENVDWDLIPEPLQYLFKSDKIILSPHIAGWTHESNLKMAQVLVEKITSIANKNS